MRAIHLAALAATVLWACALERPPGLSGGGGAPTPAPAPADPGDCGGAGDADGDCVPDAQDLCSSTTAGRSVWPSGAWAGCAAGQLRDADDADRDGVADDSDRCPGTPAGQAADPLGCAAGQSPPAPGPEVDSGSAPDLLSPDVGVDPNPGGVQLSAEEQDLMDAINTARQQLGLGTLVVDEQLMCAARAMIASGGCGHYAGGSWIDRAQQCGMGSQAAWLVNEIVAQGQMDGADAVDSWHSSPGHWRGLTHEKATTIGVAVRPGDRCYIAMFDCCIQGSGQ